MADAFFSFFILLYFLVRPCPINIPITNRHVFITGGSSGIGLALAHRAAADGARVSLTKLEEAKNSVKHATGVEVGIFDAVKKVVDESWSVLCVGIGENGIE